MNLEDLENQIKDLKMEELRQWDRLDNHTIQIAKWRGVLIGFTVAATVFGGLMGVVVAQVLK